MIRTPLIYRAKRHLLYVVVSFDPLIRGQHPLPLSLLSASIVEPALTTYMIVHDDEPDMRQIDYLLLIHMHYKISAQPSINAEHVLLAMVF